MKSRGFLLFKTLLLSTSSRNVLRTTKDKKKKPRGGGLENWRHDLDSTHTPSMATHRQEEHHSYRDPP